MFTSGALLALRRSIISGQFVLLAKPPASHPSALACLPSSCTLCPTLFTLWVLPGSQLGGVTSGPVRPSAKEKGRRSSGFDMLPEEELVQMCFEIFILLACSILLSCCMLWIFFTLLCLNFSTVERSFHFVWIRTFCLCCWQILSTPTFL